MQAVEFTSETTEQGKLPLPEHLADSLPHSTKVRVIILFPADERDNAAWSRCTAEQFLKGYGPGDAIYDKG